MAGPASSDALIKSILTSSRTVALIGASANPARPSNGVMAFLLHKGFEVFPVNPGLSGQMLHGRMVYARLADIPAAIDMVDVFRASDAVPAVVDEMLALPTVPKVLWLQLGVIHAAAAAKAESHGLTVIMDRCPAIEMPRLGL